MNSQKQNQFWRDGTFLRELQCIVRASKWIYFRPREETSCDGTECAQALFLAMFSCLQLKKFLPHNNANNIQLLNPKDYKHINAKCDTLFIICLCWFLFNLTFLYLCWVMGRCCTMTKAYSWYLLKCSFLFIFSRFLATVIPQTSYAGWENNLNFASFEFAASPFIECSLGAVGAVMLHIYHLKIFHYPTDLCFVPSYYFPFQGQRFKSLQFL